jgi:hypothetical protein
MPDSDKKPFMKDARELDVSIEGGGLPAAMLERLLKRGNCRVRRATVESRVGVPAVMLGTAARMLLRDIFSSDDLLEGAWPIARRRVQWGDADPVVVPHEGWVTSSNQILQRLPPSEDIAGNASLPDWRLFTAVPLPEPASAHPFGSRVARVFRVSLASEADSHACYSESLDAGWLFLLPTSDAEASLLAIGDLDAQDPLRGSMLVAPAVAKSRAQQGQFPCAPTVTDPFCGEHWLACGSVAATFDPICGDGVGNAAREAILAAAIVRASRHEPAAELLALYRQRLWAGMHRHLELCLQFYQTGGTGSWWRQQVSDLENGIRRCAQRLYATRPTSYQLAGFDLVRSGHSLIDTKRG